MILTKEQLFKRVAADTRGVATAPTDGSNEWNQWSEWTDQELFNFGEVNDWPEFKNLNYTVQAQQSGTSLALPRNFKKLAGYVDINGVINKEVDADIFTKLASDSSGVRIGYDQGWFLNWKTPLLSQASVVVPIQFYPTGLASPTSAIAMRNPEYLSKRLQVRILKYRQDPIFTEIEAEADLLLRQMIENEYYKHEQYASPMSDHLSDSGFTLGVD